MPTYCILVFTVYFAKTLHLQRWFCCPVVLLQIRRVGTPELSIQRVPQQSEPSIKVIEQLFANRNVVVEQTLRPGFIDTEKRGVKCSKLPQSAW